MSVRRRGRRRGLEAMAVIALLALFTSIVGNDTASTAATKRRTKTTTTKKRAPTSTVAPSVATIVPPTTTTPPPPPTANFARCQNSTLECADVTVPVDPKNPAAEPVTLFVSRRKANNPAARIGVLFVNPGGPGGPTYDLVRGASRFLTPEVLDRFDVIGVDPRGTSRSIPLRCDVGLITPEVSNSPNLSADERLRRYYEEFARTCASSDGDRLQYLDTETAARDIEAVRRALGEEKISFLGMSYGTYLGAVYRSLFPTRVRSMILDSAVDPSRFGVNQCCLCLLGI